jgi:hypothetical protein
MGNDEPFIGSEALAGKRLLRRQLRSRFSAVFPDVYMLRGVELTAARRATAGWLWSHRHGVLAGSTAAAWHGSKWVDEALPVELIWSNPRPPVGIRTYDARLRADEFGPVAGVPVTTPQRTAFDIGRRGAIGDAVARVDALMQASAVKVGDVAELADRYGGARGLRQLETVLELTDSGAESPKETWLRLLLIRAGLPRPTTQIPAVGPDSRKTYFLDMGWEDSMVAAEYDGEQHRLDREQYAKDIRRREELDRLGWIVVRVVAGDRSTDIVRRVRTALASRQPSLR